MVSKWAIYYSHSYRGGLEPIVPFLTIPHVDSFHTLCSRDSYSSIIIIHCVCWKSRFGCELLLSQIATITTKRSIKLNRINVNLFFSTKIDSLGCRTFIDGPIVHRKHSCSLGLKQVKTKLSASLVNRILRHLHNKADVDIFRKKSSCQFKQSDSMWLITKSRDSMWSTLIFARQFHWQWPFRHPKCGAVH